jgi:molybdopterin-guanine dinucleotide biosynthesis protein A
MGRDKATLAWGAADLLDHTLRRLAALTDDVRILSGPEPRYAERGRPVLPDAVAGVGAIAALATALRALGPGQSALLLAVDLPFVSNGLLQQLAGTAPGWDAVVPMSVAGAEPFCASYRFECRPAVDRAIAAGRLKMTAFWDEVRVYRLEGAPLAAFGDPSRLFANLNTPEDYERLRAATEP